MNFTLTEEQTLIQQAAKEFALEHLEPFAAKRDQESHFPKEIIGKMAELDLLGMPYPTEYGGAGADYLSYILVVEELSKSDSGIAIALSAHASLGSYPIYKWGSEALKQKYLVPLCKGEKFGAFCLTEPGAGTDAGAGKTTAVADGDSYVINGTKCFITNGGVADVYVMFALTNPAIGVKGISAFVVEGGMPGLEIGKHEDKLGIRSSQTTEVIMKNVRVPKENLIGKEGEGFKIAMQTLDGGRIGVAAQALGIAEGALTEAVKFAKERVQFGKPIAANQGIQWKIAEMKTQIEAARYLLYSAAVKKGEEKSISLEAAMAKMFCSEIALDVCDKAVQIHGGYGYIKDFKVERLYRDAKICTIYEGTNEVQRMVVAGAVLR